MRKKERAERVMERLNSQYPETPVPLDHNDAFTLLIAVLLSAQCTDKKVNEVTPELFRIGPNPVAMADLEESDILATIRQLVLGASLNAQLYSRRKLSLVPRWVVWPC